MDGKDIIIILKEGKKEYAPELEKFEYGNEGELKITIRDSDFFKFLDFFIEENLDAIEKDPALKDRIAGFVFRLKGYCNGMFSLSFVQIILGNFDYASVGEKHLKASEIFGVRDEYVKSVIKQSYNYWDVINILSKEDFQKFRKEIMKGFYDEILCSSFQYLVTKNFNFKFKEMEDEARRFFNLIYRHFPQWFKKRIYYYVKAGYLKKSSPVLKVLPDDIKEYVIRSLIGEGEI